MTPNGFIQSCCRNDVMRMIDLYCNKSLTGILTGIAMDTILLAVLDGVISTSSQDLAQVCQKDTRAALSSD